MKNLLISAITLFLLYMTAIPVCANNSAEQDSGFSYTCFVKKHLSEEAEQLNMFLAKYFKAFENRDIKELNELYADKYISGDHLDKKSVIELIKQSWDVSGDLQYSSEIQNVRFDTNFAAVEINENLTGITKSKSDITNDNGLIESFTRTVFYLQKFGKGWKIVSDKTIYEETSIKYGKAKDLDINIYTPEQVFKNKNYSISLETEIPPDTFALGSITNEPLLYPRKSAEELFRQVPSDLNLLERVVKANKDSLNELAVGSLSFCTVKKGSFTVPEIDVTGTAVLIKRVNVE